MRDTWTWSIPPQVNSVEVMSDVEVCEHIKQLSVGEIAHVTLQHNNDIVEAHLFFRDRRRNGFQHTKVYISVVEVDKKNGATLQARILLPGGSQTEPVHIAPHILCFN